jgi:DNA invertase Pin-like site-specific DNA recombinase
MRIFAYLRASTNKQDALRAKQSLKDLAKQYGKQISHFYVENVSGAKLERPQLNQLIADSEIGDILLIESMDRLTRLNGDDWRILNGRLQANGIHKVVLDLPISHRRLDDNYKDDPTLDLIDTVLFEVWASMARADYEKRRERQSQGIAKIKADPKLHAQKYKGKQPNFQTYLNILEWRKVGKSYSEIEKLVNVTRATISKAIKWGNDVTASGKKPLPIYDNKNKTLVFASDTTKRTKKTNDM